MPLSHPETNDLTEKIIGAAFAVHYEFKAGLLENAYEEALVIELEERQLLFERQPSKPLFYKTHAIPAVYRPDLIVDHAVIVEVKAVEKVLAVHKAQVLTYMRMCQMKVGLLFNFNVASMKDGITRLSL